jgi:nucleoside-diphosphate-sugar epimerase/predicted dehydrogenase
MRAKQSPRLALIGWGADAEFRFIEALSRLRWPPSILIDASPELAAPGSIRKRGRTSARVQRSSNWQSAAAEFDAAVVALPPSHRALTSTALLKAGKHVFIEMPIASTGAECQAMIDAANENRVLASAGLYRRYLRTDRWIKALLESRVLGDIEHFEVREGNAHQSDISSGLVLQPSLADGGALAAIGSHTLDSLVWWFGELTLVDYRDDREGGIETECVLNCRFSSNASGRIEISRTRRLDNSVRIEGVNGFVEASLHQNKIIAGSINALAFKHDGVGVDDLHPQPATDLLQSALNDFKISINNGVQVGASANDGRMSVDLVEQCYFNRAPLVHSWTAIPATALESTVSTSPRLPHGCKVLVTGATGFVGGRLVERLIKTYGAKVRASVRNMETVARLARFPVDLIQANLSDGDEMTRATNGAEYVFHCAYDTRSPQENVIGLRNLIDACARGSVRRLIHVSTFAVYEPFPDGPLSEETRDGDRSNAYVVTKLALEGMVFDAVKNRGLAATIIQPSIVYGPFCSPWTNTPAEMLLGGDVILPDRGEGLCNAVYIDDLVDGLMLAAIVPAAIGERFIVSGPAPVTWATFYEEIARALGVEPPKFWPHERIATAADRVFLQQIRRAASNPKQLIKMLARSKPARQALLAGLDLLPLQLKLRLLNAYFQSQPRHRETFIPHRQVLALYSSKAVTDSEKARAKLGYRPRFDFQRGMKLTGDYLQWAYADILQSNTKA